MTTVFIVLPFIHNNSQTHKIKHKRRAKFVIFRPAFCVTVLEAVYRGQEDASVCVCLCKCANMCVCFFSHFFFWNKYAQHILGEIDDIAGEKNIYHFCLWLIVVLGMAALQRGRGGGGGVYVKWGIRGEREMEKRCKTAVEEEWEKRRRQKLLLLKGLKQLNRKLSSDVSKCLLLCDNCVLQRVCE